MNKSDIASERYVCRKCIQDSGLQEVVARHEVKEKCSYCKARKAALLEYVTDRMRSAIGTMYGSLENNLDANGQIPDSYSGIEDVLKEVGFKVQSEELLADIISVFGDEPYTEDREKAFLQRVRHQAWHDFKHLVKHKRRYTFATFGQPLGSELDELVWNTHNLLENIAKAISDLSLVVEVKPGKAFWRVRVHDTGTTIENPKGYTSPPLEHAKYPNRMSPAGVSMFYGTDDFETAVLETTDPETDTANKAASGIQFVSKTDLSILDLTNLPKLGSFFLDWDLSKRISVGFLSSFVADVSSSIQKDGREHIEYVPTQVFTEFVRHELPGHDQVDGIKYRSSKNGRGSYVLFVEQDGCLPPADGKATQQVLEGVPGSLQTALCQWCLPDSKGSKPTKKPKSRSAKAIGGE